MQVDDYAEADRREVNPPIEVESATWSPGGTLDWWVKERQQWLGRVRGPDGRQRWVKAADYVRRNRWACSSREVHPSVSSLSVLAQSRQHEYDRTETESDDTAQLANAGTFKPCTSTVICHTEYL
jgi:hypothetical protein